MKSKRQLLSICFSLILLLNGMLSGLTGCSYKKKEITKNGFYFDTIITISLYDCSDEDVINGCFNLAKECENLFSNTKENSDISRINAHPKEYVKVDERTIYLLDQAISYCESSNETFDISLGKLVDIWNISELSKNSDNNNNEVSKDVLPDNQKLQEIIQSIDYSAIKINKETNEVCLTNPDAKIDLGAIAKGYIADLIKQYLLDKGVHSACITLGGNVLTIGTKPDQKPFHIGIQKPFTDRGEILGYLKVNDESVVTSGIYERYITCENKLYHHILNPKTGYPVENNLYSVTILSKESIDGDALSTICYSLGLEEGMKYIEALDHIEAVFVDSNNQIYCSNGIKDSFVKK